MPTPKLSTTQIKQIPLKQLLPDPDQPRKAFEKVSLQALADNIKQRGIQLPLLVRVAAGKIFIKDGERRWRAAGLAKLKTVPVLLVGADQDAAQRLMDQVAVNSLREGLKPMEMARTLVRMRDHDKLSANDIAARITKQGMPMNQAHIANMMKLVELPAWAQGMVDEEQIEVASAREIAGITDKPVLAHLEKTLRQEIGWRGRVTSSEASSSIRGAYRNVGIDLKRTDSYYDDAVLFDYKKVCKGCPGLRESHGGAYCFDASGFKKHQVEAKEAGLGPGGVRAKRDSAKASGEKKLTPAQQKKVDAEKESLRAESLEKKTEHYLHNWARQRVQDALATFQHSSTAGRLVTFAAAGQPGIPVYDFDRGWQRHGYRKARDVAAKGGRPSIAAYFVSKQGDDAGVEHALLAIQVVEYLPLPETLHAAHALFGADITTLWKVDASYLDLLQKAELAQVAEKHASLPEGRKSWDALKASELRDAILAVQDQVGVPPTLARLYTEPQARRVVEDSDNDDDSEDGDDNFSDGDEDEE